MKQNKLPVFQRDVTMVMASIIIGIFHVLSDRETQKLPLNWSTLHTLKRYGI